MYEVKNLEQVIEDPMERHSSPIVLAFQLTILSKCQALSWALA